MRRKYKIFKYLDVLAPFIPVPLFWFDTNGVCLGANELCLDVTGAASLDELIGKTTAEVHPKAIADELQRNLDLAISTGGTVRAEEVIKDLVTGEERYFMAIRSPLSNENGVIVGVVVTSIEITDRKKAELLTIENEAHKATLQEQEKFETLAEQVAHDIRSPLASLSMIVEMCKEIPELRRIALRDVATSINDIANNLLSRYKNSEDEEAIENKMSQPFLLSLVLSEVLSSKKYQYNDSLIDFNFSLTPNSHFVCICGNKSNFRRMISNLINNAVEAFDDKEGVVDLELSLDDECVKVVIQDNGKGIPEEVLDRINSGIVVTSGKKDGSGIGLGQVREVLLSCKGEMSIESKIGEGTKITLTFPKVETASWIAKEIELNKNDIVVILDDDLSIHGAWKSRFEAYESELNIQDFRLGEEAIDFINSLSPEERATVFLLSDYELINQEWNGLQIIDQLSIHNRCLLVTSHYNSQKVRDLAAKAGIKILPKQLASEIPIKIEEKEVKNTTSKLKKVELVIIDDDQILADSLANFLKDRFTEVEAYYHPNHFLKNLSRYAKDTIICMDYDLKAETNGIELAKQLSEAGYAKLYLLSGKIFEEGEVPNYLTVLLKGDMESLNKLS